MGNYCERSGMLFLSTLSLRRATNSAYGALDGASISIHALLAESDELVKADTGEHLISIHALLAESDALHHSQFFGFVISIHALLAESDSQQPRGTTKTT